MTCCGAPEREPQYKKKELEKVAACILQSHLLKVFSWI